MKPGTCLAIFVLSSSLILPAFCAETLRAGWARIDITPEQPVSLAGYASRKELSQGVHDPLSARALAFDLNGSRLVLVSTDNLGFYGGTAESTRAAILEQCRLKPAELFLCAIHTHSAPTLTLDSSRGHANNIAYTKALQGKLVQVTQAALANLKPAQLGVGLGSSPVGVNRREVVRKEDGTTSITLGRNPYGPCDPEVQVLKLKFSNQEQPAALLFAYATHSTSLGPKNLIISGDVHGTAELFLEKQFGTDTIAAGFAGASGDIDPWYRVLPGFNTNNGWVPETVLLGTMLGEEVAGVAQRIGTAPTDGPIRSAFKTLELPGKAGNDGAASVAKINVSVARIGDIAFVGLGGEIFNQIGKTIKFGSPYRQTFIFTHCNGTAGYMPTADCYSAGGYEVQNTAFGAGAADQLVKNSLHLLEELKSGQ